MPRPPSNHPTDGELEILNILWDHGPTPLGDIRAALPRDSAASTVATMLRVMQDKGLVRRTGTGRAATWSAAVTRGKTARKMVRKLVDHVFDGAAEQLAAHLIEGGQLSARQLAEIRHLIDAQTKGRK